MLRSESHMGSMYDVNSEDDSAALVCADLNCCVDFCIQVEADRIRIDG